MRASVAALALALTAAVGVGQVFNNNNNNGNDESERARARNAAVATARGQVQRAEQLLNVAQQRVQANWKANPQYLATVQEQAEAKKAFGAARDRVMEKLKSDPQFAGARQGELDAADDVRDEQAKTNSTQPAAQPGSTSLPSPSADQMMAAQDKLNHRAQLRKMLDSAVAADPEAAKTRDRLDKANADLQAFSLQLKATQLNDPDYKSALDQLTQARAQLAQAAGSN